MAARFDEKVFVKRILQSRDTRAMYVVRQRLSIRFNEHLRGDVSLIANGESISYAIRYPRLSMNSDFDCSCTNERSCIGSFLR